MTSQASAAITRFVAFIETPWTGAGQDCATYLQGRGVTPIILSKDPEHLHPALLADFAALGVEIRRCDTDSVDAMVAACRDLSREGELAGVTSVYEYYCALGAEVAARLGLPGPDPAAAHACRDKQRSRELMAAVPGLNPEFEICDSADAAVRAAGRIGFPVVVKPIDLTGSVHVRRCDTTGDVVELTELILGLGSYLGHEVAARVVVEECVPGPEFSAEVMHGRVLGLTQKLSSSPPHFIEMGHVFPAAVDTATAERLAGKVEQAVKAVGITWGPAHVELKLTADGADARIIEVNGRVAGGRIPELVRIASGVDLCAIHMDSMLGGTPDLTLECERTAVAHFVMLEPAGRLADVLGLELAARQEGVHEVTLRPGVQVGMTYEPNGSNRDRAAWIVAEGADAAEAFARAKAAGGLVEFVWDGAADPAGR